MSGLLIVMSFPIQYDWIAYKHIMGIDTTCFQKKKRKVLISRLTFRLKAHLNIKVERFGLSFAKFLLFLFLCYLYLIILLVMFFSFLSF